MHRNDIGAGSAVRTDPAPALGRLIAVTDALREHCGWTARLTPERLAPYLLEEAAEVSESVAAGQLGASLASELGDVLFQLVLHARLAEDRGDFTFTDIVEALEAKLLRRNTHVFGPDGEVLAAPDHDPDAAEVAWQRAKAAERAQRSARAAAAGEPDPVEAAAHDPLQGLPASLSALSLAQKALGRAVGRTGLYGAPLTREGRGGAEPVGPADAPATPPGTLASTSASMDAAASSADSTDAAGAADGADAAQRLGDAILDQVIAARAAGIDADRALRDALVRRLTVSRAPRP